jgi:hypothetical protein
LPEVIPARAHVPESRVVGAVPSFLIRHGITRSAVVRLAVVVSMLIVIGVRFERTIVAIAISAVFVTVFTVLGRPASDEPLE